MDLEKIENELLEWAAHYEVWIKPIQKHSNELWNRVNKDGYTPEDMDRDGRAFYEQRRAEWDPAPEIGPLMDGMCQGYLTATPEERARCRSVVEVLSVLFDKLGGFVHVCARHIHGPGDVEWLRKGLAAVSIQNGGHDWRDVLVSLAEICVAAERAGIDPVPYFQDVARMSIGVIGTHDDLSISEMLADFQDYSILKERRSKKSEAE